MARNNDGLNRTKKSIRDGKAATLLGLLAMIGSFAATYLLPPEHVGSSLWSIAKLGFVTSFALLSAGFIRFFSACMDKRRWELAVICLALSVVFALLWLVFFRDLL